MYYPVLQELQTFHLKFFAALLKWHHHIESAKPEISSQEQVLPDQ